MTETGRARTAKEQTTSRREVVYGGALLAALGTISHRLGAAAQATPGATAANSVLLAQSFGRGSLFPTQGDVGVLPYTAILWDAADRGFLALSAAGGSTGLASTEAVLSALNAADESVSAVLLTLSADSGAGGAIWAMRLRAGQLGSDPGAVTYQGEPLTGGDAPAWLGTAPPELPDGPRDLGAGYLVIAGLPGF